MKKPTRSKLSLAAETVRALSVVDLAAVHGGGKASTVVACRPASAGASICDSQCATCTCQTGL